MILRDIIPYLDKPAVSGSLDTDITGFAYDSRLIGPGIAFVAILRRLSMCKGKALPLQVLHRSNSKVISAD